MISKGFKDELYDIIPIGSYALGTVDMESDLDIVCIFVKSLKDRTELLE